MPIKKAAMKALRQTVKRTQINKIAKAEIASLRVKLRKATDTGKIDEAKELARAVGKKLDKAVSRKLFKKNTAARLKSRMMKKLNALKK